MRTSRIDRCEPRYAGTEFTNRDFIHFVRETTIFCSDVYCYVCIGITKIIDWHLTSIHYLRVFKPVKHLSTTTDSLVKFENDWVDIFHTSHLTSVLDLRKLSQQLTMLLQAYKQQANKCRWLYMFNAFKHGTDEWRDGTDIGIFRNGKSAVAKYHALQALDRAIRYTIRWSPCGPTKSEYCAVGVCKYMAFWDNSSQVKSNKIFKCNTRKKLQESIRLKPY